MPRFAGIGYYDLSGLYTSYIAKQKQHLIESPAPHDHKVRVLELINDREESGVFKGWKSAQSLLHKVGQRIRALPQPAEIVFAYVRAFEPGAYSGWFRDDSIDPAGFMRVHVLLNPAPAFRLYSDEETWAPAPWIATVADHKGAVSASNFNGPSTAHEIVLEMALDVAG